MIKEWSKRCSKEKKRCLFIRNPCNTNTNQMEAVFDYGVATGNPATGTGAFKIKTNSTFNATLFSQ